MEACKGICPGCGQDIDIGVTCQGCEEAYGREHPPYTVGRLQKGYKGGKFLVAACPNCLGRITSVPYKRVTRTACQHCHKPFVLSKDRFYKEAQAPRVEQDYDPDKLAKRLLGLMLATPLLGMVALVFGIVVLGRFGAVAAALPMVLVLALATRAMFKARPV